MANTKQAKKMIRKIRRRTQYNRWWKGKITRAIRTLDEIIAGPTTDEAKIKENYHTFQQVVDRASTKGIIHKNKGARMKSRMTARILQVIKGEK